MGILDGNVVLAGEKTERQDRQERETRQPRNDSRTDNKSYNNYNNGNNRNRNFNNNRGYNNDRGYQKNSKSKSRRSFSSENYMTHSNSSYLPEEERMLEEEQERETRNKPDARVDAIFRFCDDFVDSKENYRNLQELVTDELPDIITYIKLYYNSTNSPRFQDALNKLIMLFCTTQFANVLNKVMDSKIWLEDDTFDKIYDSIGFAISVALETNHERMHTDVIKTYIFKIISRLFSPEINDICNRSGVTKDLALDLTIAIPISETGWNSYNIDAFAPRFLDKMLLHAEDNMDILNWEVQGILYEMFFGKTKTALKIIGKYLVSEERPKVESDIVNAVYEEFKKMLYKKLDRFDIGDIEYVFRFVSKYKASHPEASTLFNSIDASKYDNVRKGLLSVMDKDSEAMTHLA